MSKRAGATGAKRTVSKDSNEIKNNSCCVYDFTSFDVEERSIKYIRDDLDLICKKYCFQIEKGEKTGTIHYQGRFSLMHKKRKSEIIKILREYGWDKFNISPTSKENRDNNFYVCKTDTRIQGPFTESNNVFIPLDVEEMVHLKPWQDKLIKNLSTYDKRSIDVIFNPSGNTGKSSLIRYMIIHHDAQILPFCNDYKDIMRMAYCVGAKKTYLIDMPRAINKEKLYQFWSGIETLKSGYCYDDRNKFRSRLINRPRICVFTNSMPDLQLLSSDMWRLWSIENDMLVEYKPPTILLEQGIPDISNTSYESDNNESSYDA